jgi:hypothetical protein
MQAVNFGAAISILVARELDLINKASVGWVERSDTHRKPPGVVRQQVTFLVLPKKVTKRRRPRCAVPSGFPRYFANKRGCATRPSGAHKTCPTAELEQCSPKPPLVCEISRRRTGERRSKAVLCVLRARLFFERGGHCPPRWFWGFWPLTFCPLCTAE